MATRFSRTREILVPEPEWTFWMDDGNQSRATGSVLGYFRNARRIFGDIAKDVHRFKPGAEVAPGIVSLPAYRPHARPHRFHGAVRQRSRCW